MVIRNWQDATPTVGPETALIWSIFRQKGSAGLNEEGSTDVGGVGIYSAYDAEPQGGRLSHAR